ncbi:hypothetical protein ACKKBF_B02020 [Auxenochlorella protothecoides x Auxenochlorella symbiontica]
MILPCNASVGLSARLPLLEGIDRPRVSNSGLQRGSTCARLDRSGTLGFRASRRLRDPCRSPPSPAWAARITQHAMTGPTIRIRSPARSPHGLPRAMPEPPRQAFDVETAPLVPRRPDAPKPLPDPDWAFASLLFLFPALGGFLFGYDIGASSGAIVSMTSPTLSGTDWYALSPLLTGLVVSSSLGGALLGSAAAFVVGDRLGRRGELLLAAGLYAGGAAGGALAPSLGAVLAARALFGLGIGFAMHAAPAYIAETSPARARGLFISLKEAVVVLGILAGYAASYAWVDASGGWRWMLGAATAPAAALAAGMAWLPESPRWLLLSGAGRGAAAAALHRTQGRNASAASVAAELAGMQAATEAESPRAGADPLGLRELARPRYRRPLAIGAGLMLFQQVTGQPSVLYYAASIFQAAGFQSSGQATGVSLGLGLFKLVMTGVAVATVDRLGRRPLLLWGVSGLVGALLCLALASGGALPIDPGLVAWTNLAALLVYVGCYQVSFGPISWLIVSEIFPLKVRGQAMALATLTNFSSNFAVSLALPSVRESIGPSATYLVFAVVGVASLVTIYNIVPETKGKTLEEIEALWMEPDVQRPL